MALRSLCAVVLVAALSTVAAGQSGTTAPAAAPPPGPDGVDEPRDPVAALNRALQSGTLRLPFEAPRGYLSAVLKALDVPVESQTLVFSETSLQAAFINPGNPRALYFNDSVAVGWVRGGDVLEVAAVDPGRGVAFYSLPQVASAAPRFQRDGRCLQCHETAFTAGVPGLLTMSMLPLSDDPLRYAQDWPVDHRTPIEDRWGGWFVTGQAVPPVHLGNVPVHHVDQSYTRLAAAPRLSAVDVDADAYPSTRSDVTSLLVLNHQTHMLNLLGRLAQEARNADYTGSTTRITQIVRDVADYLLFVDEAPLPAAVRGSSGFAEVFAAKGPRDSRGRSLRDLDLSVRLLRHPCSYLIYSPAFDALPAAAKGLVYARMWRILSGEELDARYARLSTGDRQAIVEILRDTKPGLPEYFQGAP